MTPATTPATTAPRLHDWPLRLDAFLRQRRAVPFAWGAQDCALFVADAVQAMTGQDPAPPGLRGLPVRAALRALRAHAPAHSFGKYGLWFNPLHALTTRALGPAMAPQLATVGDVLMLPMGRRWALALCNGSTAIGPGPHGLVHVSPAGALAAWRVG